MSDTFTDRCHRDSDTGIHIPGCMGCAVYGGQYESGHSPDHCTCGPMGSTHDEQMRRFRRIEKRLDRLEKALADPDEADRP